MEIITRDPRSRYRYKGYDFCQKAYVMPQCHFQIGQQKKMFSPIKDQNHAWVRDNIHGKIDVFKQATDQTTIELPWPLNITPKPSGKATLANASL